MYKNVNREILMTRFSIPRYYYYYQINNNKNLKEMVYFFRYCVAILKKNGRHKSGNKKKKRKELQSLYGKGIDNIFNIFDVENRPTGLVVLFACRYAIITRHTKSPRKKKKEKRKTSFFFFFFRYSRRSKQTKFVSRQYIYLYNIFLLLLFFSTLTLKSVKKERNSPQRVGGSGFCREWETWKRCAMNIIKSGTGLFFVFFIKWEEFHSPTRWKKKGILQKMLKKTTDYEIKMEDQIILVAFLYFHVFLLCV